ncbi:hypothetical protein P879_02485 [Paragonimus westermani]|uniref:Uncharacterized protein n=1 Tax=Paragonimus westermani TaxID=34504 RepID=A0A8T0DS64_9TREM|nr:hypothetical protein P879_02485 [Paragonimus westermani]
MELTACRKYSFSHLSGWTPNQSNVCENNLEGLRPTAGLELHYQCWRHRCSINKHISLRRLSFVTVVRTPTSEERCPLVRPRCPKIGPRSHGHSK